MSRITTHVLDISRGRPAEGISIVLEMRVAGGEWKSLGEGETDADGRLKNLLASQSAFEPGVYRLKFDTAAYFSERGVESFYPEVCVLFEVRDLSQHYHVPLLLSPFGYSTYRGS